MRAAILAALSAAALCFVTTDSTKSHDKAYNAIISRYYTTDPFFMVKKTGVDNRRQEADSPRQIPAPLLVGGGASKSKGRAPIRMHIKKKKKKNLISKAKKVLRKKSPKLIRSSSAQKKRQVFSELLSYSGEVVTTEASPRKQTVIAQVRDFSLPGQLGEGVVGTDSNDNNFNDVGGEIIRNRPLGDIPEGGNLPELLGPTDNSVFPGQPGAPPRSAIIYIRIYVLYLILMLMELQNAYLAYIPGLYCTVVLQLFLSFKN